MGPQEVKKQSYPKWRELSLEQRALVRELRKDGWSLWDATIMAARCGLTKPTIVNTVGGLETCAPCRCA
jgi:hypothetical protein